MTSISSSNLGCSLLEFHQPTLEWWKSMERPSHQPGCAGQVKFIQAEAQVRRESWCWYQQGGCMDGRGHSPALPTFICTSLLLPQPAGTPGDGRWEMPVIAPGPSCATARKGTVPSRHYLGPGLALGGLGPGLAWDGMEKSPLPPCSQRQPGPGWELYLWHRWLRAENPLSSCLCSEAAVPTSSWLGICALVNWSFLSLWIKIGLRRYYIGISKGISSHFGSSQIFRRPQHNAWALEILVPCAWRT